MIYISGPMTGIDDLNRKAFYDAEEELRSTGAVVFNPHKNPFHPKNMTDEQDIWRWYMRLDVRMLTQCDAIYMLPHWQNSKGAVWEHRIAEMLGLHLMYAPIPDQQLEMVLND